jgi:DNA polymerase-3 subunit gamma/tau
LVRIIETLAPATNEVKKSLQSSLPLELAFIKLTADHSATRDLEARVVKLEQLLSNLTFAKATSKITTISEPVMPAGSDPAAPKTAIDIGRPLDGAVSGVTETGFEQWPAFLEAVKKKKRTLGALIQEGKPLNYNGRELRVGLPSHLKFHLENLMLPQNKELLESIIKEICGADVSLSCVPLPDEQPVRAEGELKPDLLSETMKLFGGEVKPLPKEET